MDVSNESVNEVKRKIEKQRKVIVILSGVIITFGIMLLF